MILSSCFECDNLSDLVSFCLENEKHVLVSYGLEYDKNILVCYELEYD